MPKFNTLQEITHATVLGRRVCITLAIFAFFVPGVRWATATMVFCIVLAIGIGRKSRICAVTAFATYVLSRVVAIVSMAGAFGLNLVFGGAIALWFSVLLLNAMRATFANQTYLQRVASSNLEEQENISSVP